MFTCCTIDLSVIILIYSGFCFLPGYKQLLALFKKLIFSLFSIRPKVTNQSGENVIKVPRHSA